jgi:hypothetical protein
MIDLLTLIPRCHEASKANGWWEPRPNAGQQLMLVVSELSEALEADRSGRKGDVLKYVASTAELAKNPQYSPFQPATFQELVKDSVGDELADAYIRLCDYAGGFQVDLSDFAGPERAAVLAMCHPDEVPANFGEALLPIVQDVLNINTARKIESALHLSGALLKLELLCHARGIDLATHIDLKLRYNATRGQKHGGKAY